MAKKVKQLELNTEEFEAAYRVHITCVPEAGMSQHRMLCDLLEQMEGLGDPKATSDDPSAVPMYTTRGGGNVVLLLTKSEENTFRKTLVEGVKRFQAWATRAVPGILDKLEGLEPADIGGNEDEAATGDEEAQPDEE